MNLPEEQPPRLPGETARYQEDPFALGELDDAQLVEVSKDFLPRPEALVFKNARRKVTITLDQGSIDFFKAEAARLKVPYQRMIRNLLTEYVNAQRHNNASPRP
jgi:predicted DNA binding CopG/RHH family protein